MLDRLLWPMLLETIFLSLSGCRSMIPFEASYIPSGSMEPTLQINDRLWINKASDATSNPARGDIIIFNPTQTLKQQGFEGAFLERIVSLPSETIAFQNGQVYINQSPLSETYVWVGDPTDFGACEDGGGTPSPFSQPVTIPPNSYVGLGNNRLNSYDSRCWGFVTKAEIIGRVVNRYWPTERAGKFKRIQY